jgi:hypothetical protein
MNISIVNLGRRLTQALAKLRGKSTDVEPCTFDEEMFIDDDTTQEITAKHRAQNNDCREDLLYPTF